MCWAPGLELWKASRELQIYRSHVPITLYCPFLTAKRYIDTDDLTSRPEPFLNIDMATDLGLVL